MPTTADQQHRVADHPGEGELQRQRVQGSRPPRERRKRQWAEQVEDQRNQDRPPRTHQHDQHAHYGHRCPELQYQQRHHRSGPRQRRHRGHHPRRGECQWHEMPVMVVQQQIRGPQRVPGRPADQDEIVPIEVAAVGDPPSDRQLQHDETPGREDHRPRIPYRRRKPSFPDDDAGAGIHVCPGRAAAAVSMTSHRSADRVWDVSTIEPRRLPPGSAQPR